MKEQHYILATAGHIDHGKSALVRTLSGSDPDRLPEEKRRGITIDLGFAHLNLVSPDGGAHYSVGIVDVPGHEDFVKNMVAGVGSVDCALLVVAADDGWMPQTEEHFQILNYLGVTHGVVALTKCDLEEADVELAVEDVREHIAETPLAEAAIVPVSSVTGTGIADLKNDLARALAMTPPPRDVGKPRLAVDRVFTLQGIGTVVTGTLNGGMLKKGQTVALQPGARKARIRSLQSHNREIDIAPPGARTAVGLTDASRDEVARGDTIALPSLGEATDTIDVLLERSANSPRRPILNNARVRVHHGSGNEPARVVLMEGKAALPGGHVFAQFRMEQPVYVLAGDRLVVRDWSETTTLAGALVIDPQARRRGFRAAKQRDLLEQCADSENPTDWVKAILRRDGAMKKEDLLRQSRFGGNDISEAFGDNEVRVTGEWVADEVSWIEAQAAAAGRIDVEHKTHPERPGVSLEVLRGRVKKILPEGAAEILLDEMGRDGFRRSGTTMARETHQLSLPPAMETAAAKVRVTLQVKPMEPPSRKDLGDPAVVRFLIDAGEAVEISPELVMGAEAYGEAVALVKKSLANGGKKASELREALDTSRRVIIPFMEKLDRNGVTVRRGDLRTLAKKLDT